MSISVVLADDHVVVRRGVRALLEGERDISIVGEAADGREAVDLVEKLRPDVLVLDLVMPGLTGLEVLRRLSATHPRTHVVVLSVHTAEGYVVEALRAGATGYVAKDATAAQIVEAVRLASHGRRFLSVPLSDRRLESGRGAARSADPFDALTAREREVLTLAARGLTNREIGTQLEISRRTAETHRANLLRKLGLKGQKDLLRYALRRGIIEV